MNDENVLCVNSELLRNRFPFENHFWKLEETDIIELPYRFVKREVAETDFSLKQLIPYALIINDKKDILCYHRCGSEKRLSGLLSAGFGGHVNDKDKGDNAFDLLRSGLVRELSEEIGLSPLLEELQFLGMINEEETEVGHCHIGVVFCINVNSLLQFIFDDEIGQPFWIKTDKLNLNEFELWSALALRLYSSKSRRILISILSDYLEPNFLLIKELEGSYDEQVFITTPKTKYSGKDKWLLKALNIDDSQVKRIHVKEDDVNVIQQALKNAGFSHGDSYMVNVTGGTKVMAIAVYNFFFTYNAVAYYVPVDRNEIHDMEGKQSPVDLKYRMNLKEYFTLHGLYHDPHNKLTYPFERANALFEKMKKVNFDRVKVNEFDISIVHHLPKQYDKVYYSGGWFEEYVYCRLKKELGLDDDEICMGAKIYRNRDEVGKDNLVDNEIDVMFMLANKLYMFECKMSITQKNKAQEQVEGYLYKLAAIAKDFGLKVNSYLVTLQDMKKSQNITESALQSIQKRKQILGIKKIIDCNDLTNSKIPIFNN